MSIQAASGGTSLSLLAANMHVPLDAWTHNRLALELDALIPTDETEALSSPTPVWSLEDLKGAALEAAHKAAFQYLHSRSGRPSDNLFGVYARSSVRLNLGQTSGCCVQWNVLQPLLCNSLLADGWLHSLEVATNLVPDESTRYLTPLLSCLSQPQCTLTGLDLTGVGLPDQGMTLLLDALKCNRSLQSLKVCDTDVYSSLTLALLQTITAPDVTFRLHTLQLWGLSTDSTTDDQSLECFALLSTYFTRTSPSPSLTDLTLLAPHQRHLSDPSSVKALCDVMSALNAAPNLVCFGIDMIPSSALVRLLQSPYAMSVRLGTIFYDSSDAPDLNLAKALRANTALASLHLDELPGAAFLAAALEHPTLQSLTQPTRGMQDVPTISHDSMFKALGSAECRLEGLVLKLDPELCIMLFEAVASNRSLTWLCLQVSSVPDSPALGLALVECVRRNSTLHTAIVIHSGALLPAKELQAALTANRALTELQWNVAEPDPSLIPAVHKALLVNRSLTAVRLGSEAKLSNECNQLLHRNQVRSMHCVPSVWLPIGALAL